MKKLHHKSGEVILGLIFVKLIAVIIIGGFLVYFLTK